MLSENPIISSNPSLRYFPNVAFYWNRSNVRLIDDGPLSFFQGRSYSASSKTFNLSDPTDGNSPEVCSSLKVAFRPQTQRPCGLLGTSTSTFTQLLCSDNMFSVALRPQKPYGLLGTGSPGRPPRLSHNPCALTTRSMLLYVYRDRDRADYYGGRTQDGHLDVHTAPVLWQHVQCCFTSTETGEPRTSTSTFRQLRSFETS